MMKRKLNKGPVLSGLVLCSCAVLLFGVVLLRACRRAYAEELLEAKYGMPFRVCRFLSGGAPYIRENRKQIYRMLCRSEDGILFEAVIADGKLEKDGFEAACIADTLADRIRLFMEAERIGGNVHVELSDSQIPEELRGKAWRLQPEAYLRFRPDLRLLICLEIPEEAVDDRELAEGIRSVMPADGMLWITRGDRKLLKRCRSYYRMHARITYDYERLTAERRCVYDSLYRFADGDRVTDRLSGF
ncbi:MAG: hypothetical protein Q4B22_10200 [Eubacteriales bacterium]|nr:hypothetical protein [Eubacteriales bacterium]